MNFFIAKNLDWTPYLVDELKETVESENIQKVKGLPLVKVEGSVEKIQVGLSLCALPEAQEIEAGSIGEQADAIVSQVQEHIENDDGINLQVFSLSEKFCVITSGRAEILRDKVHKKLKRSQYIVKRNYDPDSLAQVQAMILPNREVHLSILESEKAKASYKGVISPFAGGFTTIKDDKDAPSRAFKKIIEAQKVMNCFMQPGETVVDLGACPGGWSYVARNRGCKVIAIDRSEVREDLLHDDQLEFYKTDAFQFKTNEPIDWAISDIICMPERILELVDTWVVTKLCRRFVFTIKFQGQDHYSILNEFKDKVDSLNDYEVILRQLNMNKNEVTLMGYLR